MKHKTKFKQTEIGMIPEDWEVSRLIEHVEIIGGGTPKTTVDEYWNGDIPWISVVDFVGDKRWIYDTEKHITQKGLENSSTKLLHKGQIIISARGTVGELGQVARDMAFNQSCYGIDGRKDLDNDYLYYLLKQKVKEFQQKGHGAVFNTITRETFDQIIIPMIELFEQRAIAKILSDLDSKIELLQSQNKTLEAIGQALFKHWFVDFEFPNEKGKPYKSSGGKMIDSELGKIPEGWEVKKLPDTASVVDCLHTKKPEQQEEGPILLQFYNISDSHSVDLSEKYRVSQKDYSIWTKNILVEEGDILFTNAGGQKIGRVPFWFKGGIGRNITAVRASSIDDIYLLQYILSSYGQEQTSKNTDHGTIFSSLNVKGIRKLEILFPSKSIVEMFSKFTRQLIKRKELNLLQTSHLIDLRDSLLPKLMSGKIRVPV